MIINAPSLANCDLLTLSEDLKALHKGGVNFFHIDLMDGHYVPNLCFPPRIISDVKNKYPEAIAEVHMMVTNPLDYIEELAERGADYVAFHIDSTSFTIRTLLQIKEKGMKAGVVINPSQSLEIIVPFIELLDYVLLMTVEPGFAGQRFIWNGLKRLEALNELRSRHKANFLIEVDGGVDYSNALECKKRGADILVTGIYMIFNQEDGIEKACHRFEAFMNEVEEK